MNDNENEGDLEHFREWNGDFICAYKRTRQEETRLTLFCDLGTIYGHSGIIVTSPGIDDYFRAFLRASLILHI